MESGVALHKSKSKKNLKIKIPRNAGSKQLTVPEDVVCIGETRVENSLQRK